MWSRSGLAVAVLMASGCAHATNAAGESPVLVQEAGAQALAPELVASLDSIVMAAVEDGEVVGISVAIASGGEQVYTRGHGRVALDEPQGVSDSTVFRIGSIAKQMTAAAVLRLEEAGRLSVDDPIRRHLPDAPAHWEGVTIHHLLTHTSGIPSYTSVPEFWERATDTLTVRQRLAFVEELPLEFEAGTRWTYSNTGYLLLGAIIEGASGVDYARYVEQMIAPLGLRETGVCRDGDARMARGYARREGALVPAISNQVGDTFADGDLCSSARDLLRWTAALAGGQVLRPGNYQRMIRRDRLDDGAEIHYGYGFDLMRLDAVGPIVEHGGGVPGFRSHLAHYPEQEVTLVVLTNTFDDSAHRLKRAIERLLFASVLPEILALDLPRERMTLYEGTFDLYLPAAGLGPFPMRILESDGQLMAEAENTSIPLLWQGGHEFVDGLQHGLRLIFDVVDGRATRLVVQRSGLEFQGGRATEGS